VTAALGDGTARAAGLPIVPSDRGGLGYAVVVEGPDVPFEDHGPRVTTEQAAVETYRTAVELARAFGATVLEPLWWPADAGEASYRVARFSSTPAHYEVESIRRGRVPVGVFGHFEIAGGRSPREWLDGTWSEPGELANLRGLIGRVGIPPELEAVIYDQGLEIHLIGYDTEDEIMSAVASLRRASPD
jgi:hypothetical protein